MAGDWSAGLTDQDDLNGYPSAANPLTAMGIDPDHAAANPEILAKLNPSVKSESPGPFNPGDPGGAQAHLMRGEGGGPSPSATTAGSGGGAGAPIEKTPPATDDTGMASLQKNLGTLTELGHNFPTEDPEVKRLTTQEQTLSTKEPLYDPQTGKMLAQDKPSVGARVWRGVRGGLTGLVTGGIPGAIEGVVDPGKVTGEAYGAPNKAYQRREQVREQQLGATNSALENARKNFEDATKARQAKAGIFKDITQTGSDIVSGSARLQDAETKALMEKATAQNYKDNLQKAEDRMAQQWQTFQMSNATKEQQIAMMQQAHEMSNQIQMMNQQFLRQRLDTTTDARVLDNQEKEDVNAIEKRYATGVTGIWNRAFNNKDKEIADTHKMYQDRRAALGIGAPAANPAAGAPSGKGVSLAQARQLPQYRGKSDAEITAAIKKYGHQVTP